MSSVVILKEKLKQGGQISKEEAWLLYEAPLAELCDAANEIRSFFCGDQFDLCTITNGKSGRCSEDCKYCAQSSFYQSAVQEYPLKSTEELIKEAKHCADEGALRYSIVTSGKRLSVEEIDRMCEAVAAIRRETGIAVCASFGLLSEGQFRQLRQSGVTRIHNNLETSRNYFPNICTTHSYEDKLEALRAARRAGLSVCSGGIMGLGETAEDRIDMALTLRAEGVCSVPINLFHPISGTPLADHPVPADDEMRRIVAMYRFLMPKASIRLAGGRGLLADQGKACFLSGANAAISGDMLTTAGVSLKTDRELLQKLHYEVRI